MTSNILKVFNFLVERLSKKALVQGLRDTARQIFFLSLYRHPVPPVLQRTLAWRSYEPTDSDREVIELGESVVHWKRRIRQSDGWYLTSDIRCTVNLQRKQV